MTSSIPRRFPGFRSDRANPSSPPLFAGRPGRALLLRLEPGVAGPRHRHLGEVHVFNVVDKRQLDTGHVVGPGGYAPRANLRSFCGG
jgi:2,4'-dihydroxyacetophenone dioxygenase